MYVPTVGKREQTKYINSICIMLSLMEWQKVNRNIIVSLIKTIPIEYQTDYLYNEVMERIQNTFSNGMKQDEII